jgi:hypothetical protein
MVNYYNFTKVNSTGGIIMVRDTATRAAVALTAARRSVRAEIKEQQATQTSLIIKEIQQAFGEMYALKEPALFAFSKRVVVPHPAKTRISVDIVKKAIVEALELAADLESHSASVEDQRILTEIQSAIESVTPIFYSYVIAALPQIRHTHHDLLLSFYKRAESFGGDRFVRRALHVVLSAYVNSRSVHTKTN